MWTCRDIERNGQRLAADPGAVRDPGIRRGLQTMVHMHRLQIGEQPALAQSRERCRRTVESSPPKSHRQ